MALQGLRLLDLRPVRQLRLRRLLFRPTRRLLWRNRLLGRLPSRRAATPAKSGILSKLRGMLPGAKKP